MDSDTNSNGWVTSARKEPKWQMSERGRRWLVSGLAASVLLAGTCAVGQNQRIGKKIFGDRVYDFRVCGFSVPLFNVGFDPLSIEVYRNGRYRTERHDRKWEEGSMVDFGDGLVKSRTAGGYREPLGDTILDALGF